MADHISRGVSQLPRVKDFFADGRFRIFLGVVFMLFSAYLLLASISYISNINADQSVLLNSTNAAIRANASQVSNSTGWFGAAASHFLVYRWLGIGPRPDTRGPDSFQTLGPNFQVAASVHNSILHCRSYHILD